MEENKAFRAINFDLIVKELKKEFGPIKYLDAYRKINKFFKENNFKHRQGSGYHSTKELTDFEVLVLFEKLVNKYPWIDKCSSRIDVTNITAIYDLKSVINDNLTLDKVKLEKYKYELKEPLESLIKKAEKKKGNPEDKTTPPFTLSPKNKTHIDK